MAVFLMMYTDSDQTKHSSDTYSDLVEQGHIVLTPWSGILASYNPTRITSIPIRVLVVENNDGYREFLNAILQATPDIEVAAVASSSDEAVEQFDALQPDLVLLDMLSGVDLANFLPNARILLLFSGGMNWKLEQLLLSPACVVGYIAMPYTPRDLHEAVRYAGHAGVRLSPEDRKHFIQTSRWVVS